MQYEIYLSESQNYKVLNFILKNQYGKTISGMSGDVLESHLFSHFCCPAASLTKDIPSRHDMEATLMKSQPYDLLSKNSTMTLQGNISRPTGNISYNLTPR